LGVEEEKITAQADYIRMMESWSRTNPNHLAFPQLADTLYSLAHCAPQEQNILHSLCQKGLASEVNLHWLYAIVKGREGDERS
jgi:hypothetical protein